MSHAKEMLEHWINTVHTIDSPEALARSIDSRVRVEGYLYNKYQRFIFSDCSQALYENGCLKIRG